MSLFHVRRGAGAPLLLVQGLSGTHLAWGEPFLSALERDFEIVAYDHRGVGKSPRVDEPFTIRDLAEDARSLLDELGWASAHVLGVSMGGMVAQELALAHPDRISTLTLGCTYAGGPSAKRTDDAVIERLTQAAASGDAERVHRVGWEVNLSPSFRADESRYAAFHAMASALPVRRRIIMFQAQALVFHDASARLGAIRAPTLVIHGDADEMLPVDNGRAIAAAIPRARLVVLEGVGHAFWWEEPERSAALVREHALAP